MSEKVMLEKISPKQRRALLALLKGETAAYAATLAGVSERQVRRWQKQAAFQEALREASAQAFAGAVRSLNDAAPFMARVLRTIAEDEEISPGVRVRAADAALNHAHRLTELYELAERVAALEARANGSLK